MNREEQELSQLMMRIEMIVRRQMMGDFRRNHQSMNSHRGQGRIMTLLKQKPDISQKELSLILDMSKQGLAELLAKLESAGYITRKPSSEDGRIMMIHLTENGKKAIDEMNDNEKDTDSIFSCLSEDEQKNFKEYLIRITKKGEESMPERFHHHRHMNW